MAITPRISPHEIEIIGFARHRNDISGAPFELKIEAVDDQCHGVFSKPIGRNVKPALLGHRQAAMFIRGALRVFIRFTEFHNVRCPPVALREASNNLMHRPPSFREERSGHS